MERMGGQVNEKEKRRMSPKNRGHKGGRNSTSRSEDSNVSSEGVSTLYRVNACDNAALVLLHYCALASVQCFIGKLLLHFVLFSGTFHALLLNNECKVMEDT